MDKLIIKDWLSEQKINYIELNEQNLIDHSPSTHVINLNEFSSYSNTFISIDHNKVKCLHDIYKNHQSIDCVHHLLYQSIGKYLPIIGYGICHIVFNYNENSVLRVSLCPDMGLYQDLSLYIDHLLIPEHTAKMQWVLLSLNGYEYPVILQDKLDKCGDCHLDEKELTSWYTEDLFNYRFKLAKIIFPKLNYTYHKYLSYLITDAQMGQCPKTGIYKIFDSEDYNGL